MIKDTVEYKLISAHYGDKVAKRSQVPLMNHINEGLIVLDRINATVYAKQAFCIHPLLQADEDLKANFNAVAFACSPAVVMLAIEYRSVANEFLSDKVVGATFDDIRLSPLFEVNEMLIADKIQNRKDFEQYHLGTHARSDELDKYFKIWLQRLGVGKEMYQSMCEGIDNAVHTS